MIYIPKQVLNPKRNSKNLEMMEKEDKKTPHINREWCKGCEICAEFCPENALALDELEKAFLAYPDKCTGCGMCELRCPDLAIELISGD